MGKGYVVCSRSLDKPVLLERERREGANFTNFPASIRVIRILAYFALKIS
jgi:hypothetical protein